MKTSMKFFMALAIVSICLSKCGGSSGEKSAKHSTQSEEMRIKQKIAEMAGEDDDFDESVLNKYEKANIDLISSME